MMKKLTERQKELWGRGLCPLCEYDYKLCDCDFEYQKLKGVER